MRGTFLLVLAVLLAALLPLRAETRAVDVALVLAIDISASVSADEHSLQMAGIAAALQSPEVREAIQSGPNRRIAIAVTQWSGLRVQRLVIPWPLWMVMTPRRPSPCASSRHRAPIPGAAHPFRWRWNMQAGSSLRPLPPRAT